jgi:hypothetical protein
MADIEVFADAIAAGLAELVARCGLHLVAAPRARDFRGPRVREHARERACDGRVTHILEIHPQGDV